MKAYCLLIFLALALNIPASAADKSLAFGATDEAPAFAIEFLENVSSELFKQLGYSISVEKLPNARALSKANAGELDGDLARVHETHQFYPNLVIVDEPIFSLHVVMVTKSLYKPIKNWQDLLPYRVGTIRGFILPKLRLDAMNHQQVSYSNNHDSLLKMLHNDRIDIAISYDTFILSNTQYANLKIEEESIESVDLYILLHKKHATLAKQATKVLANMKKDGSYDTLLQKFKNKSLKN